MRALPPLRLALPAAAFAAFAAAAQTPLAPGQELRPLYAMSADLAEGRALAQAACASCHGEAGVSAKPGVPSLAGQRPSYLYLELRAYQAGERSDREMTQKVRFLSDEALVKVAAYYASLDPPAPPPGALAEFGDRGALGKAAVVSCGPCHGENGVSRKAGVPSLIGQSPKYLAEAMRAYVNGDRPLAEGAQEMKTALAALSPAEIEAVASHYAGITQGLARAATPIGDQAKPGKDSLALCVKCHGEDGIGTSPASPNLAGQDWTYMVAALRAYKDKSRDDDVMGPRAAKLQEADLRALAAYYASLAPRPAQAARPLSASEWADRCDRCHGLDGNSVRPTAPSLASQRQDYLEKALTDYRAGARASLEMSAMASILSDDDIKALAAHYAFRKARPAVFVLVPAPAK